MHGKPCEGARMRQRCAKELWPNEAADTIDCVAEEERRILTTTHSSSSMESSVHSNSAFCGSGCGASELLPGRLEASELPGRLDAVESGISAAEASQLGVRAEERKEGPEQKSRQVGWTCIDVGMQRRKKNFMPPRVVAAKSCSCRWGPCPRPIPRLACLFSFFLFWWRRAVLPSLP